MDLRSVLRFRRNVGALVGLLLVAALVLFAVFAPMLSVHAPNTPDFDFGRGPFGTPAPPTARHLFGTDTIFRDVFVRLAVGGRLSLQVALLSSLVATLVGTTVGIFAGHFSGAQPKVRLDRILYALAACSLLVAALLYRAHDASAASALWAAIPFAGAAVGASFLGRLLVLPALDLDDLLMRLVDVLLAFPFLLLLMAISSAIDRTTSTTIFLVLGLTAWPGAARIIRGKTLQLRSMEYMLAARALGQSTARILLLHVLPNVASTSIVLATSSIASMIVAESALSFLGLSVPPPTPTWGRMLDEGRPYYAAAPWLLAAPAVAILLAVLGFNLLGEGLRDALDPKDGA